VPFQRQLVVVLFLMGCGCIRAQEYSFQYLGAADGLTNLAVRQIHQDRGGFLWVSTENGIFRYDGDRFEEFGQAQGLPSSSGAAFGEGPDGALLIGGAFGLFRMRGNRFERVALPANGISWAQGIASDGKGHTYLGTEAGLMELSSGAGGNPYEIRRVAPAPGAMGPGASAVMADGDSIWYGCGRKLCRTDPGGIRFYGPGEGLPESTVLVIRKDGPGNVWVRFKNAGVYLLERGGTRFHKPDAPVAEDSFVGVPAVDEGGRMLLLSSEVLLIHGGGPRDGGWQRIGRAQGLRGTPYAAFQDREGTLWIGLAGRGLARWRGYREWESYTVESGLGTDLVYEILPMPDGTVLAATEAGLYRGSRKDSGFRWRRVEGVGSFPVHSIRRAPDGDLWIGTETHGAARIRSLSGTGTGGVEWFGEAQGLIGKAPYSMRFDTGKSLWAATDAGLFEAKPPYRRFSRIAALPATRFWTVAEGSDGTMWAGGADGLFACAGGLWKNYSAGRSEKLSNREVISLAADRDGSIWTGYRFGGGIDHVRLADGRLRVTRGTQMPGSNGIVYFLEFDARGRLWAGTERGVDVRENSDAGGAWTHYDTENGLVWDDCNLNAFAAEKDGVVWIGTSGGLSRFTPLPRARAEATPTVIFTKLTMGRTDVSEIAHPSLGFRSNSLSARYSALNVPPQSHLTFRYRLLPSRQTWTETAQRELELAELPPGEYRLEVETRDPKGRWVTPGALFSFEIQTPWYRKWWFSALCALAPLSIVAGLMRMRLIGARKRERELVRIVDERTTDLVRLNRELERLSSVDSLTGLANRRIFDRALARQFGELEKTGRAFSLILIDVDHFKALNDSEGHQRGDECLRLVGAELGRFAWQDGEVAARYGGEEFALIVPGADASAAARLAGEVCLAVQRLDLPNLASPGERVLTVSVGVAAATGEDSCRTPAELIAAADQALYRAKKNGRNRAEVAEGWSCTAPRPL
jgi:diguanylate cyclase (GGDEF)-like protein